MLDVIPYWIRVWFRGMFIAAITLTLVTIFGDFYPPLHESGARSLFWIGVFAAIMMLLSFNYDLGMYIDEID